MSTDASTLRATQAVASIPRNNDGPVFREPWQAEAFALALSLHERGLFAWNEWAATLGDEIKKAQAAGDPDTGETYYHHWLNTLERIVAEKGVTDVQQLKRTRHAWEHACARTPLALQSNFSQAISTTKKLAIQENPMSGETVKIRANAGGEFDCYVIAPKTDTPVPAIVLASAIHGVDPDIKEIADEFAAEGFIAAAPDLFWRSIPDPLHRDDERALKRAQPRLEKIKTGEQDLKDTLAYLNTLPLFNGKAAVMGFCYGGPYSILGPKRLGFAAGISCHGSQLQDYVQELEGLHEPVCIIWGDRDHVAPAQVLDLYRPLPERMKTLEVHIFPGIQHGFMMHNAAEAFDQKTRDFSMARANAILEGLRSTPTMRQAS